MDVAGSARTDGVLCTGLRWDRSSPGLWFLDHDRPVMHPVASGQEVAWAVAAPRRCIGVAIGDRRRPCAFADVPEDNASQCPACAQRDPGKRMVRERSTPAGTFRAYLAFFGPGALKVGLTAAARGDDRLLEQGAWAHVWLCEGAFPAVRRVENLLT